MKRYKLSLFMIVFTACTFILDACSFSVEVLTTPTSPPPTLTSVPATPTPAPPTAIVPSATAASIPIGANVIQMLWNFQSFKVDDVVRGLAFTPDSKVLAVAEGDDEKFDIHLWDVSGGQSLGRLSGHTNIVWDVAFSPNGELLASVSSDKTAKIWDWRKQTLLKSLEFPGEVVSVRFSPDGQTLAVGGVDTVQNQVQNAAVWTYAVGSWNPLLKLPEYIDVTALAYSPKGGILIGGGTSRNVQAWNATDGAPLFTLNHAHQVFEAAISPSGSTVATGTCEIVAYPECTEGSVWLWELPTGKLMRKLTGFADFVEHVAFTVDGSVLVAASRDGVLDFYGTSDYRSLYAFKPSGGVSALALAPDGMLLATGTASGEVHLWKIVPPP